MRRGARRALAATAAIGVTAAAAVAAERAAVRRARSGHDPDLGEDLSERPANQRFVSSFDGTRLAVAEAGPTARRVRGGARDPVIVFSHGFSLDMTAWHFQWTRLSRRYRCILYDHRGHGRSDPAANGDYSMDALGRDLKAVLDDAAPGSGAVLVGHSMGGMAILSLAADHPELFGETIAGVVLANTSASDLLREAAGGLAAAAAALIRRSVAGLSSRPARVDRIRSRASGPGADLAFLIARATNFGPGASASVVDHVTRVSAGTPTEVWIELLQNLFDLDLLHALESVRVPAIVLVGERDRLTPPASARAIADAIPGARLVVLDGAGHCAMLEQYERFNAELEGLLGEVAAAPARRAPA